MDNQENIYAYSGNEKIGNEGIGNAEGISTFFNKVFLLMMVGVFITFAITYGIIYFAPISFLEVLYVYYYAFLILELVVVLFVKARVAKLSTFGAITGFVVYAILNGITFSVLCVLYGADLFTSALLTTTAYFGILAVYGFVTKKDLSNLGTTLRISLIAIIILSVINFFVLSSSVDFFLAIATLVVFTGYTTYDIQKLKRLYIEVNTNNETGINLSKVAVYGALELYLDFINLFLSILRILSRFSRD